MSSVSEWEETTLGAEADLLTGFPFKSERYTDSADSIPLVRGDNIVQGAMRWDGVKRWPLSERGEHELYELREGDVVLAMDRPWIEAGLKYAAISKHDLPCLLVQRTARLRGGPKLNIGFLRYLIGSLEFTQHIHAITTGTAVPHISGRQIKDFAFALPPLAEQKAIAAVLGALDDKIELNRRMNATLEAMARALFQSWFVDFDPVRAKLDGRPPAALDPATAALFPDTFRDSEAGHIPKGWTLQPVGEVVDCVGGGTPSTAEPKYWEGGTHYWTTPKDFSSLQAPILLDTDRKLTDAGIAKISSGLLPAGTLLLSSRAPVGYLAIAAMPVAINQGFIAMKCNERASNFFMLNWCQTNMAEIESRATGTTFAEISKQNFRPIRVVLPPKELMAAFTAKVAPLYDQITANLQQSRTLATLRDTLLPKLLSGELSLAALRESMDEMDPMDTSKKPTQR
jgi:type I restriction enzyme S subunit